MLSFESPGFLPLLLLLPVAIHFRHFRRGRGGRIPFSFSVWQGASFSPASGPLRLLLAVSSFCFWIGVALLVVALAGPVNTTRERIYLSRGVDIMFVLDESPSMFARDFDQTTRYAAAKSVIEDFVKRRENDPVGLVSFAKDALLRVPPTLDYGAFYRALASLVPGTLGNGTAIGVGIAVAVYQLRSSSAKEKVIVLLTDGENNAGEIQPEEAARIAARFGIRIYAIGIGSSGESQINYTDPETGKRYLGVVRDAYDKRLLESIADATDGRYFSARSAQSFQSILGAIDSMETVEKRVTVRRSSAPIHRSFILVGLAFVLCDFLVRKVLLREVLA